MIGDRWVPPPLLDPRKQIEFPQPFTRQQRKQRDAQTRIYGCFNTRPTLADLRLAKVSYTGSSDSS